MTTATDRRPTPGAPAQTLTPTDPTAQQLAAWVDEDNIRMIEVCDKVFGVATAGLTIAAIVCALLGKTSAITAVLLLAFVVVNLTMSKVGSRMPRLRAEMIRTALNAPVVVSINTLSDGAMQGMWLPILINVAGCAVSYAVATRNAKSGYAFTLWNIGLLLVSAALGDGLGSASVLWQCIALFVVGFVVSTVVRKFGETALEARVKRHEAETHKRNLERSLRQLDEGNRGMRLVLDSVAQGFITVDLDGVLASERSGVVDQWFGEPAPGATFDAFMARHDPDLATWFALGLESMRDGFLPVELCLEQMPKRFSAGAKSFDIKYSPILRDGQTRILIIISDITEHLINERAECEQREMVTLFQRITSDRAGFEEFMDEATALVASLAAPGDRLTQRRTIHTLKGNCAIYGFERYVALCHRIESELVESDAAVNDDQRAALADAWRAVAAQVRRLLGETRRNVVEVELPELARVVDKARQGIPSRDLASVLTSWSHEPVARRFERLGRYATDLARRLGKGELEVAISADGIRLDAARWHGFWSAAVHAVRNAVDHGIDGPNARALAGKPARATLAFTATRAHGQLTLCFVDDGGGIDWDLVRARAAALGMPADSPSDLEAALFADGFSTRREVTNTAGRGVGMAALRSAVAVLGGTIELESQRGEGTMLRCRFPDAASHSPVLRLPSQPIHTAM
jgi:two-component system, chemotaxis family, sensor kinase CheA